jgi:RNA polymerase sigma-70 factor (ECF subfamily)
MESMILDQATLVRLLLSHRAMLVGYIGSIVRDPHLAEDVFQNVSIIVLKKAAALQDAASFAVWARKIARFEALNAVRREEKAPRPLQQEVLDLLETHWDAGDPPASAESDALKDCLSKLAPRSRQVVELRYQENVSGKALAERLAQPLNTVYVALSRAHRALLACVKLRLSQGGSIHA